ncbi:ABC transporter substrate-binding protein [Actinomadura atramentaria]|uniref:ABC transporter substrate-binding protein n=1 Tax=Actinomadura atramentaria TaxID=1990 RepID=UPI00037AF596|nr:ABC transporter substrate-binding protein [Actinomadura atramentaria]
MRTGSPRGRAPLTVAVLALLTASLLTGCGSRLTPAQRAAALGRTGRDGAGPAAAPTGSAGALPSASAPSADAGDGGGGKDAAACKGRGGKSDTGVTPGEITIANVVDRSGPVPGLFTDVQNAVQAYAAYFNSTQTICGRKLKVLPLDARTDAAGEQQATVQGCRQAFALVGGMSAYDQAGAGPAADCKIPDLRAVAVTRQRQQSPVTYAVDAHRLGLMSTAAPDLLKQKYPDAVRKAAFVYLKAESSEQTAKDWMAGYAKRGLNFVYKQAIDVDDFNYAPYVTKMKNAGVKLVFWLGSGEFAVRMQKTMRQQGFTPEVFYTDNTAYTPSYVKQGGSAVDGTVIPIASVMLEESAQSAELRRYAEWLRKTAPGASPTSFGMYGWAAAKLFTETAAKVGPNLTRTAFLDKLKQVKEYTGGGMLAPQGVGTRQPGACERLIRLSGGTWRPLAPTGSRYRCGGLVGTGG